MLLTEWGIFVCIVFCICWSGFARSQEQSRVERPHPRTQLISVLLTSIMCWSLGCTQLLSRLCFNFSFYFLFLEKIKYIEEKSWSGWTDTLSFFIIFVIPSRMSWESVTHSCSWPIASVCVQWHRLLVLRNCSSSRAFRNTSAKGPLLLEEPYRRIAPPVLAPWTGKSFIISYKENSEWP